MRDPPTINTRKQNPFILKGLDSYLRMSQLELCIYILRTRQVRRHLPLFIGMRNTSIYTRQRVEQKSYSTTHDYSAHTSKKNDWYLGHICESQTKECGFVVHRVGPVRERRARGGGLEVRKNIHIRTAYVRVGTHTWECCNGYRRCTCTYIYPYKSRRIKAIAVPHPAPAPAKK